MMKSINWITEDQYGPVVEIAAKRAFQSNELYQTVSNEIVSRMIKLSGGCIATISAFVGVIVQSEKDGLRLDLILYACICFLLTILTLLSSRWCKARYHHISLWDEYRRAREVSRYVRNSTHGRIVINTMEDIEQMLKKERRNNWLYWRPAKLLIAIGYITFGMACVLTVIAFAGLK